MRCVTAASERLDDAFPAILQLFPIPPQLLLELVLRFSTGVYKLSWRRTVVTARLGLSHIVVFHDFKFGFAEA